jgi:hypothetical protein
MMTTRHLVAALTLAFMMLAGSSTHAAPPELTLLRWRPTTLERRQQPLVAYAETLAERTEARDAAAALGGDTFLPDLVGAATTAFGPATSGQWLLREGRLLGRTTNETSAFVLMNEGVEPDRPSVANVPLGGWLQLVSGTCQDALRTLGRPSNLAHDNVF